MSGSDPITAVIHIPKAAGHTLQWISRRQFPESTWIRVRSEGNDPAEFYRALTPEQREKVRLLDDATCVGAHECFERPIQYVALVRNPVEPVPRPRLYAGDHLQPLMVGLEFMKAALRGGRLAVLRDADGYHDLVPPLAEEPERRFEPRDVARMPQ